jgi:hypothetical protein
LLEIHVADGPATCLLVSVADSGHLSSHFAKQLNLPPKTVFEKPLRPSTFGIGNNQFVGTPPL